MSSHPMMVFFSKPLLVLTMYAGIDGRPWGYSRRCFLLIIQIAKYVDCLVVMRPLSGLASSVILETGRMVCGVMKISFFLEGENREDHQALRLLHEHFHALSMVWLLDAWPGKVFSTWMAFKGNTCDVGSFREETDEIIDLHQIHEEILFSKRDPSSDGVRDLVTASEI
ncbi:hypothetical protein Tco_0217539 [Tanacetum coccineum]